MPDARIFFPLAPLDSTSFGDRQIKEGLGGLWRFASFGEDWRARVGRCVCLHTRTTRKQTKQNTLSLPHLLSKYLLAAIAHSGFRSHLQACQHPSLLAPEKLLESDHNNSHLCHRLVSTNNTNHNNSNQRVTPDKSTTNGTINVRTWTCFDI